MDKERVRQAARQMIKALGENPDRENLEETWSRRVPDLWGELTEGYREEEKPEMRSFPAEHRELVAKQDIPFHSICEHHLLPFSGVAHIAYVPNGEIVGLSKLIRYTRWRGRKLQSQEQLTREIAEGLMDEIDARGVMVVTEAEHMCEAMRGIETPDTTTIVSAVRGVFDDPPEGKNPREEFLSLLRD